MAESQIIQSPCSFYCASIILHLETKGRPKSWSSSVCKAETYRIPFENNLDFPNSLGCYKENTHTLYSKLNREIGEPLKTSSVFLVSFRLYSGKVFHEDDDNHHHSLLFICSFPTIIISDRTGLRSLPAIREKVNEFIIVRRVSSALESFPDSPSSSFSLYIFHFKAGNPPRRHQQQQSECQRSPFSTTVK